MGGVSAVLYGGVAYVFFVATFLYAIGFVGNLLVPKSIDSAASVPPLEALMINLVLLALFAVQHSVMAREGFKRLWTRVVPKAVERSTYVVFSCFALVLLFGQWQAIPAVVWDLKATAAVTAMHVIFWLGFGIALVTTFLLSHFELFGLSQVYSRFLGREMPTPVFRTPFFYKRVRHPLYFGFLLAFWATPTMTLGHLLFAVGTTGYILLAVWFEERDLISHFGEQYRRYREDVPMIVPLLRRRAGNRVAESKPEVL